MDKLYIPRNYLFSGKYKPITQTIIRAIVKLVVEIFYGFSMIF